MQLKRLFHTMTWKTGPIFKSQQCWLFLCAKIDPNIVKEVVVVHWNAELYDRKHNFVAQYGKNLLHFIPQAPQQTILDLGCGTGTLTAKLQAYGQVTGIDASQDMITKAQQDFPQLHFLVGNGLTLPATPQYDVIFSNAVFHWIPDHPTLLVHIFV